MKYIFQKAFSIKKSCGIVIKFSDVLCRHSEGPHMVPGFLK